MKHAELGEATFNDDWITDGAAPDPTPLPQVAGWHILVRPVPIRRKSKGGVILPDKVKDDLAYLTTVARVLAMGPLCYRRDDMAVNGIVVPWCKVGDYVAYGKMAGNKLIYKGVRLILLNDDHVRMVLERPEDVDPMNPLM